jgi:hypothetical protein
MANIVEKKERVEGLGVGRHLPSHPTVATDGVTTSSCRGSWRLWLAPGGGEDGWGGGVRQGRGWGARAAFIAEAGLMVDTVHMAWRGDHVGASTSEAAVAQYWPREQAPQGEGGQDVSLARHRGLECSGRC